MKKRLAWVLVLAMVMTFVLAVPAAAAEGELTIHAKPAAEWTTPALWAWDSVGGTNVFSAWPGQVLTADPDNAGWFYYSVPDTTDNIIINDNGAGQQTIDVPIEAQELWITVTDAGSDGKYNAEVIYEAPEGFVVAGAEVAAETVETTEAAADVPKTGAASFALVYAGLAGLAGVGAMASKKRNTK